MTFDSLTAAEQTFIRRMLPHFMAGKSVSECAGAVIEDDNRLFKALIEDRPVRAIGAQGDGDATSYKTTEAAAGLRSAITSEVYRKLRR